MIDVIDLSLKQGDFSLNQINLKVDQGSYAILMGETGSGKTSVLEAIVGLKEIKSGSIHLDGRDVTNNSPAERGLGYVPQDACLFKTMSVRDNIGFSLSLRKWSPSQIDERVLELAEKLSLTNHLNRSVMKLSGGEIQRVALGRALAFKPNILVMDEPLSALDEDSKGFLVELLKDLQEEGQLTVLHVTHSESEARLLGDHLFTFSEGKINPSYI